MSQTYLFSYTKNILHFKFEYEGLSSAYMRMTKANNLSLLINFDYVINGNALNIPLLHYK